MDGISKRKPMQLLRELSEALTQASGGATGLVQQSGNAPGFMIIRESIDLMREGVLGVASSTGIIAPARRPH